MTQPTDDPEKPFAVVLVFADGTSRVASSRSLDTAFRQWSRRFPPFLPSVAFRADPALVSQLLDGKKLPATITTVEAARLFWRAPLDVDALKPISRHLRRDREAALAPFRLWAAACSAAAERPAERPDLLNRRAS